MKEQPFKLTIRVSFAMQLIQIFVALLFTVCALAVLPTISSSPVLGIVLFLLFLSFAYFGWANAFSTIQVTEKSIIVNVFYGRFRINWDEVDLILMNSPMIAFINTGSGKRLVISLGFASKKKKELLQFIHQQIERRNIHFENKNINFPITHQNVRVWN